MMTAVDTSNPDVAAIDGAPDGVSLRRWAVMFVLYLAVLAVPAWWMLGRLGRPWTELLTAPGICAPMWQQSLRLLIFMLYLSICCTFLPLPTGWLVAAIATRAIALTPQWWTTVALVATAGAVASTMANLNDYHLFTWMMRHRRLAAVRQTRRVRAVRQWFSRKPFALLVVFSFVPIPIDVVRMLAATNRYDRGAFAGANFIGRFFRYGILAGLAFATDVSPGQAAVILLAAAAVLGAIRLTPVVVRKLAGKPTR